MGLDSIFAALQSEGLQLGVSGGVIRQGSSYTLFQTQDKCQYPITAYQYTSILRAPDNLYM